MAPLKAKAPLAHHSEGALGSIVHHHGNARDILPSIYEVQTNFIARRTRLAPHLAAIVAGLVFGGAQ